MNQVWAGLGGGGLRVSFELLSAIQKEGRIEKMDSDTGGGPPTGFEKEDEGLGPYLTAANNTEIDVTYFGIDTDNEIVPSLKQTDPKAYDDLTKLKYISIIEQLGGTGTGGNPGRIRELANRTPGIDKFIKNVSTSDAGLFVPIFSLDGGSGHGFFKHIINMIDDDEIYQEGNHGVTTIPISISPHRSQDRSVGGDGPHRLASDNVREGLEYIESQLDAGLISSCVIVDNDFSAFNREINKNKVHYDQALEKITPILAGGGPETFEDFYVDAPDVALEDANKSIVKALKPFTTMALRGPNGVKFGKTTLAGYDHSDIEEFFDGSFVVPSHLSLSARKESDEIFDTYSFNDWEEKLSYLCYYTFLGSCAPIDADKIENVKIFVWEDGENTHVTESLESEVSSIVNDIGISRSAITVDSVTGISSTQSKVKIWTLTGMNSLSGYLTNKYDEETYSS